MRLIVEGKDVENSINMWTANPYLTCQVWPTHNRVEC